MSFFNSILQKVGLGKGEKKTQAATPEIAAEEVAPQAVEEATAEGTAAVEVIDVVGLLEEKAEGSGLNWKTSIVDLLKLLDLDSSLAARKELAAELECPPNLAAGSTEMNIWLHKTVLQKIAENGGNISSELFS